MATNDVQNSAGSNNNNVAVDDVFSFNHNISSNATITAFHSISSDVNSAARRFMPSAVDQQAYADEHDESLPTFPSPPLLSSLLMHEQPNHANDQTRGEEQSLPTSQINKDSPLSSPRREKKPGSFSLLIRPTLEHFSFLLRRREIPSTCLDNSIRAIISPDQEYLLCRRQDISTSSTEYRRAGSHVWHSYQWGEHVAHADDVLLVEFVVFTLRLDTLLS